MGYAGGTSSNPTYVKIGDHMESIQVRFDPRVLPFERLLRIIWQEHDFSHQRPSRQYMNAVFYHSKEQEDQISKSMNNLSGRVETEIEPYSGFYPAEDYHQKFYLQRHLEVKKEFSFFYPDFDSFVASTSSARVNGFLGGYGSRADLEKILPKLGLSSKISDLLRRKTERRT